MGDEFSFRPLVSKSFLVLIFYISTILFYTIWLVLTLSYIYVTRVFPPIPRSTCCLLCNFIASPVDDHWWHKTWHTCDVLLAMSMRATGWWGAKTGTKRQRWWKNTSTSQVFCFGAWCWGCWLPGYRAGASWAMVPRGGSVTITGTRTMGTGECLLTVSGWGSISYHATGEGVGMASSVLWNYCVVIKAKKGFSTIYYIPLSKFIFV